MFHTQCIVLYQMQVNLGGYRVSMLMMYWVKAEKSTVVTRPKNVALFAAVFGHAYIVGQEGKLIFSWIRV